MVWIRGVGARALVEKRFFASLRHCAALNSGQNDS